MIDKPEISVRLVRLSDGTLIDPLTRQPVASPATNAHDDVPSVDNVDDGAPHPHASTIVPLARRSILDLTLNAQQMAVVNNVLVYTMWGLPDDEIAMQCKCSIDDVITVRELHEYGTMRDALIDGVRASYVASAHGVLSEHAVIAAKTVVSQLRSPSNRMKFDAARDILDRSGHRPADHSSVSINLNRGTDDQLVIRVVRDQDRPSIPTLDIQLNGA